MKTTKEKAEIMLAFDRGENVVRVSSAGLTTTWEFLPHGVEPIWDWRDFDYRTAEKPKEKIKMLCYIQGDGLIWCNENSAQVGMNWKRFPAGDLEGEVGE